MGVIFYLNICVMLKKKFVSLFFLLSAFLTQAQKFNAHILGGVATSQVSGDQLSGFNKAGFIGGAGVSTVLSKKVDLGFEIYYIQKGSKKQSDPEKGDYEYYRLRLNYIEVPLLLEYHISDKLGFEIGPSVAVLISYSEENQDGEISSLLYYDQPQFSKYDISICGGLAYHFNNHWGLYFRGLQSLVPIRENSSGARAQLNSGQYNSVLSFALYYQFGKKKKNE